MSTISGKRKRARKACIPCRQRKRKCDATYPCSMCATYEYSCTYADTNVHINGNASTTAITATHSAPPVKRAIDVGSSNIPSEENDVDGHRFRSIGSSAAMAYPHILSKELAPDDSFKMHSHAYNFGIRPDEASSTHSLLRELISEDDLTHYSGVYFSSIGPIGHVVDPRIYAQRCKDQFHESDRSNNSTNFAFSAVAAGIAALGSFLSTKRHARESDLVQYAKAILDDPASMRKVEVDHVIAWGMRFLYLRANARPNNAWIASCTAMHLCEAVGLHEEDNINKISLAAGAAALGHDVDRLRRIFWILWAGHIMLSYECDRSSVNFRAVTTQNIMPVSSSIAHQFVQIAQIVPSFNSPFQLSHESQTQIEKLSSRLKALQELQVADPFLLVTKADLAFCFYRRAYQIKTGISDEFTQLVIDEGDAAVQAAQQLAHQGRFFWNVIGSVFHYICVLLAINTASASTHLAAAFRGLETLVMVADTDHTREALSMAQHLLSLHLARKRKELAELEQVQVNHQSIQAQPEQDTSIDLPEFGYGIDWDQFLFEPYIDIFSGTVQS